jgi:predicted nucleotidyltransferase
MKQLKELFLITYGSKLYGTSTPTSDTDNKVIYLPAFMDVMLGRKHKVFKKRVDASGNKVPDGNPMPDDGVETEYIPLQTFMLDFVKGQTYAVEVMCGYLAESFDHNGEDAALYHFLRKFYDEYSNNDVHSMVGFAKKQTLDYVHRGARLEAAKHTFEVIYNYSLKYKDGRLDTPAGFADNKTVLDLVLQKLPDLHEGSVTNNNRKLRTLELNSRSYAETTSLFHLLGVLQKQIDAYGERSNAAALSKADYKSLSHAVRVYQQSLELLETGKVTFPRPNAAYLLSVKQGLVDQEVVRQQLIDLEKEVDEKLPTSTMQKRTPELEESAEEFIFMVLMYFYDLMKKD